MSYTNFTNYSHGTLRDMVQNMNSGEVMAASDPWRRAADTLKAIHTSLGSASGEAALDWEGSTSDAFYAKMTKLSNSINNTASYAHDAAETLKHMAEAIDLAKKTMPEEPGLWDQVTDAVGDTASSAFGGDDEDTKTAVKDEKKAQAAAVMQTLAMKYRVAKDVLKPPRPPVDDSHDIPAPGDPTGAAAIGALITGAGLGAVGSAGGSGSGAGGRVSSRTVGSSVASTPTPPRTTATPAPTDPAIKGGSAHPVAKAPAPISFGPGTGIDGAILTSPPTGSGNGHIGSGGGGNASGTGTTGSGGISGGLGHNGIGGAGYGSKSGVVTGGTGGLSSGQNRSGAAGSGIGRAGSGSNAPRSGSAFGSGGMGEGGGLGSGGRSGAGGRTGGSLARQAGGVAGEAGHGTTGTGRKSSFTEGGSGLGARSRAQGEQGQGGHGKGAQGQGIPAGDARRKKDKENGGRRPDYLVEDEETWVSGQPSNPNVVE
ncbi:WXG100 family type VII secretion target [Kitasatospora sp. NPDC057223]|uniref:WXG100 family type VII secretion target n=1 Tax=Kitasatospora sp. NPDC057223 TaxID=3346055 RepID=UPI00363C1EB1